MREEVANNWAQAQEDLETARILLETERYYASVFFSQQAAEKALKALYVQTKRELPKTHNLVELAIALEAPGEVIEAAQELTPDYLVSRYVNAAAGVPAQMYNSKSAKMHLDYAEAVMEWTRKSLLK
jgi:HEPN domain-containing protein